MAQKNYKLEVGKGMFAKDATITHQHYGMDIELEGVDPEDVVNLLTPEEISSIFIQIVDLDDMLKDLVAKHGIGEVVYSLQAIGGEYDVIGALYECDSDAVKLFVEERNDPKL